MNPRVILSFRTTVVLLGFAAAPVYLASDGAAAPASPPAVDEYLISWKVTAAGHGIAPSDSSSDFAFEATQSSASEGQAVVRFDAQGNRLDGRIVRGYLSDELDTKMLPVAIKIRCGPISVWEHNHYSLKTLEPLAGTDRPAWMPEAPRKQQDGTWLVRAVFHEFLWGGKTDARFATLRLHESWRDEWHWEKRSGPMHSVCDSPMLPSEFKVQDPVFFDVAAHTHRIEPAASGNARPNFDLPSAGPSPDFFVKEWKFRVPHRTCSGPGTCGTIPVDVNWKITVRRLGKCHVSGEIPLNDDPPNPDINDEEIEMGVEHGSASIDPDAGVAALNIRLTCDQVPIKNAKVDLKVDVQKNTGGHTHNPADRPRGRLKWNGVETRLTDKTPSIRVNTDDDGRAHLEFKPGKAVVCGKHNDKGKTPRTDAAGECDKFGIAGIYRFTATSVRFPDRKAEGVVEAKVDGLSNLAADPNYVNDVGAGAHTSGDNATAATQQKLPLFARDFLEAQGEHNRQLAACGAAQWPLYPLWVIDVSLPFGGLYDLPSGTGAGTWSSPHQTHGRGDGMDLSVHRRKDSATAWPADGLNVAICDGYRIAPQGWLMMKMYERGKKFGHWDLADFNAASQPWHLHVDQ